MTLHADFPRIRDAIADGSLATKAREALDLAIAAKEWGRVAAFAEVLDRIAAFDRADFQAAAICQDYVHRIFAIQALEAAGDNGGGGGFRLTAKLTRDAIDRAESADKGTADHE